MRYSEDTLNNWTAPLTKTEEQRAENTIKMIQNAINANYELKAMNIEVFTQGSFANNTNVRSESDVDVVVMLKSTFFDEYPEGIDRSYYGFVPGSVTFDHYRELVKSALKDKFGISYITDGNKSIKVHENTYHVNADVVPAFQYRNYKYHNSRHADDFVEGIKFYAKDRTEIINYPKKHRENGIKKNSATGRNYKAMVRIMKHIKNDMAERNIIDDNIISSFLTECLVWNVPNNKLTAYQTWTETLKQVIIFLYNAIDENKHREWGEVSEMFYLFHADQKWTDQDAKEFLHLAWKYLGYAD